MSINEQPELTYPVSLSKYLSICGIASRRKSTELIKKGVVSVNNSTVFEPGLKITESDMITCEGKEVSFGKRYYVMLHKPRGYVCTSDDPYAEKKAIDLVDIPGARLFTAGRLDKESEGLIIVTNDGDYAAQLTHPRYQTLKTYHVKVDRPLTPEDLTDFCKGIQDNGEVLKARSVRPLSEKIYEFKLTEGKNREIRRMIASTKRKTVRLKRIATGKLSLHDLKPGTWRFLTDEEIALSLKK